MNEEKWEKETRRLIRSKLEQLENITVKLDKWMSKKTSDIQEVDYILSEFLLQLSHYRLKKTDLFIKKINSSLRNDDAIIDLINIDNSTIKILTERQRASIQMLIQPKIMKKIDPSFNDRINKIAKKMKKEGIK